MQSTRLSKFDMKYQKVEDDKIGQGAQGSVFKVVKKNDPNGKVYAAKIYTPKEGGAEHIIFETEILMYAILPKMPMFGKLVEYFDEADRKILILEFIEGHEFKHHQERLPCQKDLTVQNILKQAIQMTKMVLVLEKYDIYFSDFHGENIMVNKDGDLVLTDFGASARISDRAGNINPKGFWANQILEKFQEKKQTPTQFKERLFNEHHGKQLLNHFKALARTIDDKEDEYLNAFNNLNVFIEKSLQKMVARQASGQYDDEDVQIQEKPMEQQDYYQAYYSNLSTLESLGTYGGKFSLKSQSALKPNSPTMSEQIMEKLRYLVFNDASLLEMTFDDSEAFKKYQESFFEKAF